MPNYDIPRRGFLEAAGFAAGAALVHGTQSAVAVEAPVPTKIKIAQIGTAHMHADKIGALRRLTDWFDVVAVADDDPNARKKHENKGGYEGLPWLSVEELLVVPGLQAVAVEVDERVPLPYARRCVEAGKHVHIDKPAGESLAEYKQILDIAESKKLVVQMGYMYRNNPAVQFCIKAVRDGLIGEIYDVDVAMNGYGENPSFRNVIKKYKGGTPYIFTCHLIDMVVSLLGKPDMIRPFNRRTRDDGVLDNALTVFKYPGDTVATMRTSINEIEGFPHRYLKVRGSKGKITIRPLESRGGQSGGTPYLALAEASGDFKKGEHPVAMPPPKGRYDDQWIEFARVINGTMENPYTYEHDLIVQQCLLEACEMHP